MESCDCDIGWVGCDVGKVMRLEFWFWGYL